MKVVLGISNSLYTSIYPHTRIKIDHVINTQAILNWREQQIVGQMNQKRSCVVGVVACTTQNFSSDPIFYNFAATTTDASIACLDPAPIFWHVADMILLHQHVPLWTTHLNHEKFVFESIAMIIPFLRLLPGPFVLSIANKHQCSFQGHHPERLVYW